ncbi:MAG: ATP-binding cassette domain-containing protein [Spirochaetaceae bacterium]|jgi:ABC-type oligopeptide transport system ATPase subunit|nr:ATP-binding cassette domain-containing protein [Spirochaetaceae bacterium]
MMTTGEQPQLIELINIERINKVFTTRAGMFGGDRFVTALKDVAFSVYPGERVGIVGESGSGKTTLARILTGLERRTGGGIRVCGLDPQNLSPEEWRVHCGNIQMVFQDSSWAMDPLMTVEHIVGEGLSIGAQTKSDRRALIEAALARVGLSGEYLHRYPHELSGGQRQRVGIARAIIQNPKILILDEPTSALDMSVQAQILNLLHDLRDAYNLTYLFISHDLGVVRYMCDRVIVMYRGEIVEKGDTERIFNAPTHPYTQELIAAIPHPPSI